VKVAARQADGFARNPDNTARAVLVYGPDSGLVSERMAALIGSVLDDPSDPFRRVDLTGDGLEADPARLGDEAAALSMTGGRRVVVVRGAGDRQARIFADVLEGPATDTLIVAEGGDLGPRSSLRRTFEGSPAAAALPCYADDAGSLADLVRRTLAEDGVTAEPDALDYLVSRLGGDRLLSRRELEKLVLFVGNGGVARAEDARAVVGDAAALTVDALVDAAAGGNREALDGLLEKSLRLGNNTVSILGATARHLQRVQIVVAQVAAGGNVEQAIRGLRPPVFFKRRSGMQQQAGLWQPRTIARALTVITEAELDCKTTGLPDRAICSRALLRVATAARSR